MSSLTPTLIAFVVLVVAIACAGFLLARQIARRNALREFERANFPLPEKETTR